MHISQGKKDSAHKTHSNMSANLATARADYRRKMAAHKARRQSENTTNKGKMYTPKKVGPITCRYCKEEGHKVGHFDKDLGRFVTTCIKAIEANKRKTAYNKRQREKTTNWQNGVSDTVAEETKTDGWSTTGSSDKTRTFDTSKTAIALAKNPFDLGEDSSDDDVDASAPAPAKQQECRGAWATGAPEVSKVPDMVSLVRAPRKSTTPTNSDSEDDAELPKIEAAPTCWGDC